MKSTLFIFFFVTVVLNSFSQDIIKKINGDTARCKILEINSVYLKYRNDTTTHFLSVDSIAGYKIEYQEYISVNKENLKKKYFFAISPGIGENHGVGGLKILIGPNGNSGLFGCFGYGILSPFWKIGLQISYKGLFFSGSFGTMEFYDVYYYGNLVYDTYQIYGVTLETGGIINLNRSKRFFIQLGIGYNFHFYEKEISPPYNIERIHLVDFSGIKPEIGIGVKF